MIQKIDSCTNDQERRIKRRTLVITPATVIRNRCQEDNTDGGWGAIDLSFFPLPMTVELIKDELGIINNAVNEVCNGIQLGREFDTRTENQ